MTNNTRNWTVFAGCIAATLAVAAAYLATAGNNDDNIRRMLRLTADAAFIVLLLVFVARPLRQLVATPLTRALLGNRRLLGIAFAAVHSAHLLLILYRHGRGGDFEFRVVESLPGGLVYLLILLMFATSFDRSARALGPRNWRFLHKTGLYVIFAAFVQAVLPRNSEEIVSVYGALTALAAAAAAIRIAAFVKRRRT